MALDEGRAARRAFLVYRTFHPTHVAAKKKKGDKPKGAERPKNVVAAARKGGDKFDARMIALLNGFLDA